MRIVDFIQREMIIPNLSGSDKPGIIRELAQHLSATYQDIDCERLISVLSDREELASTAIGQGVAIPHGKLGALDEIRACVGRVRAGVNFDSMDGKPTYIFIVIVVPENSSGIHLKALARISRVFKGEEILQQLLTAPDSDSIYTILAEKDARS